MRCIIRNKIFLLLIYADDILIFADEAELKRIESFFMEEFRWITMNVGNILSYSGMQILLEQRVVTIDMSYDFEEALKGYGNLSQCSMPGKKTLFTVDEKAELLLQAD
jgi:hypothetical protein